MRLCSEFGISLLDHSGGISFEEFYTWWSNNDLDSNQKGERASFLKMKLQSKSYIRNIIAKSHKLSTPENVSIRLSC